MKEQQGTVLKKKFSLIDFLMILMLVGIVAALIIPIREDKKNMAKVNEALRDMQVIIKADVDFKNHPDNGYYAFDLSMLNIEDKLAKNYFEYTLSDTTVNAITKAEFGVVGAEIYYYLPEGPWVVKDDEVSRSVIDPNWLP
ncbi:MAG: hypothetical protein WCX83_04850 [Candidatus Cloacimonas sp.]|nr:hypothetical protein [Candidatus Cloacimonadota bacterium]